jgi:hypothetical protein
MGLIENGKVQDLGSRLVDTGSGNALAIGGLALTAASDKDVPVPDRGSSGALLGLAMVGCFGLRKVLAK